LKRGCFFAAQYPGDAKAPVVIRYQFSFPVVKMIRDKMIAPRPDTLNHMIGNLHGKYNLLTLENRYLFRLTADFNINTTAR
jgi:hypothetical protein